MSQQTREIIDGMKLWLETRNDLTLAGQATLRALIKELEYSIDSDDIE